MAEQDDFTAPRPWADAAVERALRRLVRQPEPPWLHGEIARRMAERLSIVKLQPARIVDWWSSLGGGAALLREAYPMARIVAVEPTAAWVDRRRDAERMPWWSPRRRAGVQVVGERDDLGAPAQLLWANMMLHAVKDPLALIVRWQRALAPDGFLMFSTFGPDTLRELRELYARLGWPAPTPAFVDMHDFGDMLVHAGFADPVMDQETLTLSWPTPRALLAELRSLGGNIAPGRMAGLRTPRWRDRLEAGLAGLAGPDGRIAARFEIAYGHAFKALPRAQPGAPTTISVDEMRALVRARRRE